MTKTVSLANPRGFCAGVDRAILIVERAIELLGKPIYVRHEVVHNKFVVNGLREKGAIFVQELDEVPDGATVIFSAHGVSKTVQAEAKRRGLNVFDATCPLVTKVHIEVSRHSRKGTEAILIGHAGHPEVIGTMGQYNNPNGGMYLVETVDDVETLSVKDETNLHYVSQTTLSVDETREIIDALRIMFHRLRYRWTKPEKLLMHYVKNSHIFKVQAKMIFVMPPKTDKMQYENSPSSVIWC